MTDPDRRRVRLKRSGGGLELPGLRFRFRFGFAFGCGRP
jgi:hypothetical protein